MTADDLLNIVTQGTLLLIALLTLADSLRHRDWPHFDIALMFGTLASLLVIQAVTRLLGQPVPWLTRTAAIVLFAHPYLLLRLVEHFRPVPRWVTWPALGGLAASAVILIIFYPTVPPALTLVLIAYFVSVEGYAAWAFVRGAWTTGGVTRNRLRLAAGGTGLLATILLLAGVNLMFPSGTGLTGTASRILAPIAIILYYFGFVPPGWLRRTWQLTALYHFLRESAKRHPNDSNLRLGHLCTEAARSVGGIASVAYVADKKDQRLSVAASTDATRVSMGTPATGPATRAFMEREPQLIALKSAARLTDSTRLTDSAAERLTAGAMYAVPITSPEHSWGLLVVYLWRTPLFATDDLELLSLFAEQTAGALSNASLLAEEVELAAEYKRAADALRTSEEKFSKAFRASPAGITVSRFADGRIIDTNDSYAQMIGLRREDVLGRTTTELGVVGASDRARITQMLREQGSVRDLEVNIQKKSGELLWVLSSLEQIELDGEPAILAIVYDITARKRAEEAERSLNVELERRTALLEMANRELESFSYSVSHDLRAPLRAIDGFSRVLEESYGAQLAPEGLRFMALVRNNTKRMGQLIDDLLAFSRLGRQAMRMQVVNMTALARQNLAELSLQYDARPIESSVAELPACTGDASLLNQVWQNLIGNALKFSSRQAKPRIEIGICPTDGPGGGAQLVYFIRDNGAGFDMQYADKLFGVFQRMHRVSEFEGTGVGLAIVQRIIQRHGGHIWAEASVGAGAVFFFTMGGVNDGNPAS